MTKTFATIVLCLFALLCVSADAAKRTEKGAAEMVSSIDQTFHSVGFRRLQGRRALRRGGGNIGSSGSRTTGTLTGKIGRYPGFRGKAPSGRVWVDFQAGNAALTFRYKVRGLPRNCHLCGVHIHEGRTCSDADKVGGHFWNRNNAGRFRPDPWVPELGAFYNSNAKGYAEGDFRVDSGYGFYQNRNRAVVLNLIPVVALSADALLLLPHKILEGST